MSRHGDKVDDEVSGSDEILDSESPLVDKKEELERIRFQLMTEMKEKESQEKQAVMAEKRRMKMEEKRKLCELRMKEREQRKEIRLKEREEKERRKREIEACRKSKESKREGKHLVQDRLAKARLLLREAQKIKRLKIKEREKEKRQLEFQELVAKRQAERKKKLELFSFTNKSKDSHVIEVVEDTPIQCENDGIPSLPLFPELEVGVSSECVTSLIFVSEFLLMFSQQLGLEHKINGGIIIMICDRICENQSYGIIINFEIRVKIDSYGLLGRSQFYYIKSFINILPIQSYLQRSLGTTLCFASHS